MDLNLMLKISFAKSDGIILDFTVCVDTENFLLLAIVSTGLVFLLVKMLYVRVRRIKMKKLRAIRIAFLFK